MKSENLVTGFFLTAGVGSGATGEYFARQAAALNENTIIKGVAETAAETTKRLTDADWYERWAGEMYLAAGTLLVLALVTFRPGRSQ